MIQCYNMISLLLGKTVAQLFAVEYQGHARILKIVEVLFRSFQ